MADGFAPGDGIVAMAAVRTVISAAAGCAAAAISGGKCADGAVSAAFANLFNKYRSRWLLRATVPGQTAWDNAVNSFRKGSCDWAAAHAGLMVGEQGLFVATLGLSRSGAAGASVVDDVALARSAQLGNKLDFFFGASSSARSPGMLSQLQSIGLQDTPANHQYLAAHLDTAAKDVAAIAKTQGNVYAVKESFLMSPNRGWKLQTTRDGNRLITGMFFQGLRK